MENSSRRDHWIGIFAAQRASGLTKKAFCASRNIKPATFYYWQKKVNAPDEVPNQGFVQLQAVADHELTVCLAGGEVVVRSTSITTLAQVVKALADA